MRAQCEQWLQDPNVRAFLRMLRVGEGTADEDGYRRHFGGDLFSDFSDHPRRAVTKNLGGRPLTSTAAGAYQFLSSTWDGCAQALKLSDFSPQSQDLAAVYLIHRRGAIQDVIAGNFETAVRKCNREWASLPESPYGQPTKTMAQVTQLYLDYGGRMTAAPMEETTMSKATEILTSPVTSFLLAAVNPILAVVPEIAKIFMDKKGTTVPERNVAAATKLVEVAQKALVDAGKPAPNAQAVVEAIQSDPAAQEVVRRAVLSDPYWLTEAGGGGIEGARKADAAMVARDGPWWQAFRSPSFLFLLLAMPPVYAIVGSIVGLWGHAWPSDVRAAIATAVVSLVVGGAAGYYWGQTTSRNRASAAPAGDSDARA